ncbi:MAG TPA: hypothetical protein DDY91_22980 [Planctomycetaceae bacterium]|nr:hypothetical protein [Planctomycetaceae bacterium]
MFRLRKSNSLGDTVLGNGPQIGGGRRIRMRRGRDAHLGAKSSGDHPQMAIHRIGCGIGVQAEHHCPTGSGRNCSGQSDAQAGRSIVNSI